MEPANPNGPRRRRDLVATLAVTLAAGSVAGIVGRLAAAGWFDTVPLLPSAVADTIEVLAAGALLVSWWTRRPGWLTRRLPAIVLAAAAVTGATAAALRLTGTITDAYPVSFGLWVGMALCALVGLPVVLVRPGRWRRWAAVMAVPLTATGALLLINDQYGMWPAVGDLLGHTGRLRGTVLRLPAPAAPGTGVLVALDPPATRSHFSHRPGSAYLPPAYFTREWATLPVVMMLAGVPGTPDQWVTSGRAVATADAYAAAHHGRAPILIFVDDNGSATGDTECVDGPQGDAETYLADDVPAYVDRILRLDPSPARWAIVGFSEGGTCAADLALAHPGTFGRFIDLAGDAEPTLGNSGHTLYRLFGGSVAAWRAHQPLRMLRTHRYPGLDAWFAAGVRDHRKIVVAEQMAAAAARSGCQVHELTGTSGHNWQFAAATFAVILPALGAELGLS